jgi:hypothetical protein
MKAGSVSVFGGKNIIDFYDISVDELTTLAEDNGNLRGMVFGYVAEYKLRRWLEARGIEYIGKSKDHDRKNKGDLIVRYEGQQFVFESKSLQTHSAKGIGVLDEKETHWHGTYQVDASDCRATTLITGRTVTTTSIQYGEFHIVSVNLFAFGNEWRFVFAKNEDLLWTDDENIPAEDRPYLIKTQQAVTWPPKPPYYTDPAPLLKQIIDRRKTSTERIYCVDTTREVVRITPHPLLIKERKSKKPRTTRKRPSKKKTAASELALPLDGVPGIEPDQTL